MMTQAELSRRSNVALVTISRLETEASPYPRAGTVKLLATALGVDPATLMFGEGEETRAQRRAG